MGIAFLSTAKNNGTAIAIALLAFTPLVAIPAAILPLFQIIFSIGYIYLAGTVKKIFTSNPSIDTGTHGASSL
jgi:ACR3 family arsenite efflux pump ArsB